MNSPLPTFRYHPDPVASGSIAASLEECRCCGAARGYIYTGPVYAESELEGALCPWCIANGSAHQRFSADFVDNEALAEGTSPVAVREITQRTPGFAAIQPERWLSCCDEPAAFLTPAGITEIRQRFPRVEGDLMSYIVHELGVSGGAARRLLDSLHRERSPTAYIFHCPHCARHLAYMDDA